MQSDRFMNKAEILNKIIASLKADLAKLVDAAKDAHVTATHEETMAKSKYDTFALEASYLAHGQAKRAEAIQDALNAYTRLKLKTFDDNSTLSVSALVVLETDDEKHETYFLGPKAGGTRVTHENTKITVITKDSPLGDALWEQKKGDEFSVGVGKKVKNYFVLSVA